MKPIIYSMFAGLFISLSIALFSIFVGTLFGSKPAISQTLPNPASPIAYCVDPDWIPYEAIRNGEHIGISSEFIKLLAKKTDFTFALVPTSSWEQTLRY